MNHLSIEHVGCLLLQLNLASPDRYTHLFSRLETTNNRGHEYSIFCGYQKKIEPESWNSFQKLNFGQLFCSFLPRKFFILFCFFLKRSWFTMLVSGARQSACFCSSCCFVLPPSPCSHRIVRQRFSHVFIPNWPELLLFLALFLT